MSDGIGFEVGAKPTNMNISAVVTRADGTVEDLGMISYWDKNPFKTFWWYLKNPKQAKHKVGKLFRRS